MKAVQLECTLIKPNPKQPRKSVRGIKELAKNIELIGQLNPITVEKVGNGNYQIIGGERRWTAIYKFLKRPKIWAFVRKPGLHETLADNMAREELSLLERIEAATDILKEKFGENYRQILTSLHNKSYRVTKKAKEMEKSCRAMGIAPTTLYLNLPVLDLPKNIKKRIIAHPEYFPNSVVLKLARLRDEKMQFTASTRIVQGRFDGRQAMRTIYKISFGETDGHFLHLLENFKKSHTTVMASLIKLLDEKELPSSVKVEFLRRVRATKDRCNEVLRQFN